MEGSDKSKEQLELEIRALKEQRDTHNAEMKKSRAANDTEGIKALQVLLSDIKEKLKPLETELKVRFPADKKAAELAKKERADKAFQKQEENKAKKFIRENTVDQTDVTKDVLEGKFSGSRFTEEKVLPIEGKENILITSALPYVNNVPHLGNIIGCVLSADVYARYCRLRGRNTLFICGTDEYGTATETKALEEGVTPMEICDKYSKLHDEIYKWFGISFDHFGRTTTAHQTEIAQDIFLNIHKGEFLVKKLVDQLFCPTCKRHLADRYVEGTCPKCGYEDARGDQCDKCGSLLNATELINAHCKMDNTAPVQVQSEHLFLDLPKINDSLCSWVSSSAAKGKWSSNGVAITNSWLKGGLQPRCITRDLKWGTPVPLEEYKEKVFYVWFDAPIGYISITANYTEHWKLWWKNPEQVTLYQFMGKDNVPFHTVIFPASLIATGEKWTLLHHVSTTEYLNYEDSNNEKVKFSKSRSVGVFGTDLGKTNIPQEVWRYYLLVNRPEVSDSLFSWTDLAVKNNTGLLANVGNFCNRCLKFIETQYKKVVPEQGSLEEIDKEFISNVNKHLGEYISAMDEVKLKEGLRVAVVEISNLCNQYLQDTKPWVLFKSDNQRCGTVINVAINAANLLGAILEPFMPSFSAKLYLQIKTEPIPIPDAFEPNVIRAGHIIGTPLPIFRQLTDGEIAALRKSFG